MERIDRPDHSDPTADRAVIEPDAEGVKAMSSLINSVIAPRPLALVSSISADGVANVAPHSTFIVAGRGGIVAFSSMGEKHTVRNVRETGSFVFNMITEGLMRQLNIAAAKVPPEESEFDWAGFTAVPSATVRAPRVGESPAALECRLLDIHAYGPRPCFLIVGEVMQAAVDPAFLDANGTMDYSRGRPVGRLNGIGFARIGEIFEMPRVSYEELVEASGQEPQGE